MAHRNAAVPQIVVSVCLEFRTDRELEKAPGVVEAVQGQDPE